MGSKKVSSTIWLLYYFTFLFGVNLDTTQAVRFPHLNSGTCPGEDFDCVAITYCHAAVKNIKKGKNPAICGWNSDIPFVCCPQDIKTTTPHPQRKISRLSPKDCGIKGTSNEGTLVYPPLSKEILDSGIEPRRRPRNESTNLEESSFLDDDANLRMFAVGGTTSSKSWPWMVGIFSGNSKKQLCGGTLIDERHIITAAHCFTGISLDPSLYSVQIGELLLHEDNRRYPVKEIKLHEDYKARYYYDDIAIMRLVSPLSNFTAACLPAEDSVRHGDNVTVLGWGDLSFGGPSTAKLQEVVDIPIVGNARCDAKFKTLIAAPFPRGITDSFLCAGLEEGGKDACQGDSGGPLLLQNPGGSWILVGIVSFGYKCGEPGYPGVYTKISAYLQWIEKFIGHQNEVATQKKAKSQNFEYIDEKPIWRSPTERVLFPR